jgi:hypothetical protein
MPGHRRKCDSFLVFEKNIDRSMAFLRVFDYYGEGRPRGAPSNDEKELLRGSVVLAVGALDAFLHDLILEVVPRFGTAVALSEALKQIAKDDPSLALRVALARTEEDRVGEFRLALDSWLSSKSFQGPEAVTRAASYVGIGLAWPELDAQVGVKAAARLTAYTQMRHHIVHRGEHPAIRRENAQEAIDLVDGIAKIINKGVVQLYNQA